MRAGRSLVRACGFVVLMIEAGGPDIDPCVQLPIGLFRLLPGVDWDSLAEPDETMGGRVDRWAASKVLGGGSSVNGMMWVPGAPTDFDGWEKLGAADWSYENLLRDFSQSDTFDRGSQGPQHVAATHVSHMTGGTFILAATQLGAPFNEDYNEQPQFGAARSQISQVRGIEWSAARGYLAGARHRRNLTVMTRAEGATSERAAGGRIRHACAAEREYQRGDAYDRRAGRRPHLGRKLTVRSNNPQQLGGNVRWISSSLTRRS
jgi:choline dehydrogenase-like flavoprotein